MQSYMSNLRLAYMSNLRLVMVCILAVGPAVGAATAATVAESFEGSYGPWRAEIGNPPVAWRVTPSTEQAFDGSWSLHFQVDGTNDDGQVFMVRELLLPAGNWTINLSFDLYSTSAGPIGAWNAIGFVGPYEPTVEADFTQSAWGARLGAIDQSGWVTYSIERTISSGTPTSAFVVFGVDAVFEVQRSYFLDNAVLTGVPVQCGDGSCYAEENACNCPSDCGTAPSVEGDCSDGQDDDCDLLVDCADPDCSSGGCVDVVCDGDLVCEAGEESCACYIDCGPAPLHETSCDDEIDNDCDGLKDCADSLDCGFHPACMGQGACDFDGVCETGEDCTNCPFDCPFGAGASCGNGVCEIADGEDCLSCAADCNGKQGGNPNSRYCCGDGAGQNPVGCGDSRCTGDGNTCSSDPAEASCCGDLVCEGSEDSFNCAIDCGAPPACGDGTCDPGENACACPADCGAPPSSESNCQDGVDEDCDGSTDCDDSDCDADAACQPCLEKGAPCGADSECCSNKCRGGSCK